MLKLTCVQDNNLELVGYNIRSKETEKDKKAYNEEVKNEVTNVQSLKKQEKRFCVILKKNDFKRKDHP